MEPIISAHYSLYEYAVFANPDDDYPADKSYHYEIYTDDQDFKFWRGTRKIAESCNDYDRLYDAEDAAKDHISRIENGEPS